MIFHEGQVARIAAALAWLHRPSVVVPALAGVVAMDVWLFAVHGAMTPVLQVLEQPLWMLIIFALTVASSSSTSSGTRLPAGTAEQCPGRSDAASS